VRGRLLSRVADLCLSLAENPDRRVAAVRGLAHSATSAEQLDALASHATEPDLRWRRLTRLAELGALDESEVEQLLAEDPNPNAWINAHRVQAALPTAEAKAQAWQAVVVDRKIPPGMLGRVGRSFWRPSQEKLLAPYAEKFLDALPLLGDAGLVWALSLSGGFYPAVGGNDGFVERLEEAAGRTTCARSCGRQCASSTSAAADARPHAPATEPSKLGGLTSRAHRRSFMPGPRERRVTLCCPAKSTHC
jgi:aminopeptidase N